MPQLLPNISQDAFKVARVSSIRLSKDRFNSNEKPSLNLSPMKFKELYDNHSSEGESIEVLTPRNQ